MEKCEVKFPSLIFKKRLFTEGRIIISDREIPEEIKGKISLLKTKEGTETLLLRTQEIAKELDVLLEKELSGLISKTDTLFVFPGRGAIEVKKLSQIPIGYFQAEVFAKRFWKPKNKPIVTVGTVSTPVGIPRRKIKTIVVLDDVISSGQTLLKLYEKNSHRFKTGCVWIGGSWLAQVPRTERIASGLTGYQKIITAIVVEGPQRKRVPLNSLSTLISDPSIAKSYAERHFQNSSEFLKILREIKIL